MITMKIEGGAELASMLNSLPRAVRLQITKAVLIEAAEPMVAVARKMAPRRPGLPDLADNIEIGNPRAGGMDKFGDEKAATVVWGPTKNFFYGYYQEWGTVHHGAHPFMRPAFDGQAERSLGIIRTRTWEHIQSYVQSRDES